MEIYGFIPEAVLQKIELGGRRMAVLCRDYRDATDEETRNRAGKEVGELFALEINSTNRDIELGITTEETDALLRVASGHAYMEWSRAEQNAEAQERKEQSAAVFAAEERAWKGKRR